MKNIFFPILFFALLVLCTWNVQAVMTQQAQTIDLLSLSRLDNNTLEGSTALLSLEITRGTGAVYLESYPLLGVDTQAATRLAQEIACEFSDVDCSQYDFFYTVRAGAPIVGGPSAGGASALLTLSMLEEIPLQEQVAMTGSIAPGGVIGPIGGVLEKTSTALKENMSVALIPQLNILTNASHKTAARKEYELLMQNTSSHLPFETIFPYVSLDEFSNLSAVYPVLTLPQALSIASQKRVDGVQSLSPESITPPSSYQTTMKGIAQQLCNQTKKLLTTLNNSSSLLVNQSQDYFSKAQQQSIQQNYYPQASFCYTANLRLRTLQLENNSQHLLRENLAKLEKSHAQFSTWLSQRELNVFSDLETYFIVKERLLESQEIADNLNQSNISSQDLAYAIERYKSAVVWSNFFDQPGTLLRLDKQHLQDACQREIQSIEVRKQYIQTFMGQSYLAQVQEGLAQTRHYQRADEFALCLFKASKTKAQANLFLSTSQIQNDSISTVIHLHQNRTAYLLSRQAGHDVFPILGFSYFDYTQQLLEDDPNSALLFSEYALTLSDLHSYFPAKTSWLDRFAEKIEWLTFFTGFIIGAGLVFLCCHKKKS